MPGGGSRSSAPAVLGAARQTEKRTCVAGSMGDPRCGCASAGESGHLHRRATCARFRGADKAIGLRYVDVREFVAQAGFDWPSVEGLFDKLTEETNELREELQEFPAPGPRPQGRGVAGSGRTGVPEALDR